MKFLYGTVDSFIKSAMFDANDQASVYGSLTN